MILYKYLTQDDAEKFLSEPLLNFTPPKYFNDPYEVSHSYPIPTDSKLVISRKQEVDNIYRTHYNVLCLTRSPLNSLMWAHYTEKHKGVVVGIDTNQSVFTSIETCSIPVQYGNVIYTFSKPASSLIKPNIGSALRYDFPNYTYENSEMLQRLFLYKSLEWAYEEEVRVVKMFGNIGLHRGDKDPLYVELREHFKIIDDDGSKYFKFKIPVNYVKEVYFGCENRLLKHEEFKNKFPYAQIFKCVTDSFSYKLKSQQL